MSIADQLTARYRGAGELVDVYGLVLFTDAHPHLVKVLNDDHYWRAFDQVSGGRWVMFSAKPHAGRRDVRSPQRGNMGLLVPVWHEPKENEALLKEFQLSSTEDLPLLLVFARDQDTGEMLKVTMDLDDSSIESAYSSLREAVALVTKVVEGTDRRYRFNAREIHRLVESSVSSAREVAYFRSTLDWLTWVKGLI
jgi:hypothetical protein